MDTFTDLTPNDKPISDAKRIVQIFMTIQIVTKELTIVEDKDGSDVERADFDAGDTKTEIILIHENYKEFNGNY